MKRPHWFCAVALALVFAVASCTDKKPEMFAEPFFGGLPGEPEPGEGWTLERAQELDFLEQALGAAEKAVLRGDGISATYYKVGGQWKPYTAAITGKTTLHPLSRYLGASRKVVLASYPAGEDDVQTDSAVSYAGPGFTYFVRFTFSGGRVSGILLGLNL